MSSGSGAGQRKEASVQRVITVPAYYPAGYDFSPFELAADRVAAFGGGGSAGGEGTGRPGSRGARSASGSRPHSYRVRTDGTIYATTAAAIAKGLDVNTDTIVAKSPRVPTPCRADVSVVLLGPEDKVGGGGAAMALGGGPLSYNFFTLPTVDFAAPRTVCILPPPSAVENAPSPSAATLRLTGAHLFGACLADSVARPVADALLKDVTSAVAERGKAEAEAFAAAMEGGVGANLTSRLASAPPPPLLFPSTATLGPQLNPAMCL